MTEPRRVTTGTGARDQVARMLALVPYLQNRRDVSLAQVAADFGVSADQIRKDLRVLWFCGLPGLTPDKMIDVDMEAIEDDPEGVVRIENAEFLARPVRLGSSEATALIVALRALREGSPPGARQVVDRVLTKLEEAAAMGSETPQVELHLPPRETEEVARSLRRALSEDRQVRLDYYVPTRDESTRRTVDPIALLHSEGNDYLDAWCHQAGARRLFRLDRMTAVEMLETARESHEDLEPRDLGAGLFEPSADDLVAVCRLAPHARWVAEYYPVTGTRELDDGRLEITLRVGDPRWLVRLALRLAPAMEVVSPGDLRAQVRRTASAALSHYGA